jgi:hypothetical protein
MDIKSFFNDKKISSVSSTVSDGTNDDDFNYFYLALEEKMNNVNKDTVKYICIQKQLAPKACHSKEILKGLIIDDFQKFCQSLNLMSCFDLKNHCCQKGIIECKNNPRKLLYSNYLDELDTFIDDYNKKLHDSVKLLTSTAKKTKKSNLETENIDLEIAKLLELKSKLEAEEKARLEAEEKARLEAEEKARLEAEEKTRLETEEKTRLEAEIKARLEAEEKSKLDGEEKLAKRKRNKQIKNLTVPSIESNSDQSDETESEKTDEKKKKIAIPKQVRTAVWDLYIGADIVKHRCLCCKKTHIKNTEFQVGHVISEKCGGTLEISNLRPICAPCNFSMGTENMIEYIKKFGYFL